VSSQRDLPRRPWCLEGCLRLAVVLLGFPLTAYRSPLTCQQSPDHSAFQRLRDSLAGITDTTALGVSLRRLRGTDPLAQGLIALRLGELRADPDFSQALASFRRATRKGRPVAEAWYGLGLAEAGRSQWEMQDQLRLGSRVGLGALERSAKDYARALDADPRFIPAAVALALVELSLLDSARLRKARDPLRRAVRAIVPPPPELLLNWGRLERATGSLDVAITAFEQFLAAGGNRPLGLLELARTRLALGQAAGNASYYEGAASDDPIATAEYRADLAVIAADSTMEEFDRLRGLSRAAFLHRFWTDRDHFELRPEGERLREHYRRLLFARTHFPLTISRRFYGRLDAYRSGNTEVDDRGIIYIRQGEPVERLRPFVFGAMPNESWRYLRAEGDLLFHFSSGYDRNGGGDLYDYRLVQSVLDLRGADDAPRDQLILSRQSLSPIYGRILNWGPYGSAHQRERERNIGATSISVGTTTDSHELRFHRRLGAVADLIAIGRSPRGGLAHFVFGIAAPGTVSRRRGNRVEYPVRVRLVALDRHDRAVATLDTAITVQLDRTLTQREYIVGRVELPLPAGRWSYRAALQQGDSGGVLLPRDTVLVVDSDGPSLTLSDIAMGSPGRAVRWVSPAADTVLLAPSGLFRERAPIEIYYEASGASAGSRYRHEISVFRSEEDRPRRKARPLVSVSFDADAAESVIRSRRTVRLDRLKRGAYIVEVRVTAPDGGSAVRRRLIHLLTAHAFVSTPIQ
jgi:GWxTD domain-containing protein